MVRESDIMEKPLTHGINYTPKASDLIVTTSAPHHNTTTSIPITSPRHLHVTQPNKDPSKHPKHHHHSTSPPPITTPTTKIQDNTTPP
jgi:hypothetical protein